MSRKRKSFTLIEVLIAVGLATAACFFLLSFEQSYIKSTRLSVIKLQEERLMQEALVCTLEALYNNQIDWKIIQDKKEVQLPLSLPEWDVRVSFAPQAHGEKVVPDLLDVLVNLNLLHHGNETRKVCQMRLCIKKGERLHVQPAA